MQPRWPREPVRPARSRAFRVSFSLSFSLGLGLGLG